MLFLILVKNGKNSSGHTKLKSLSSNESKRLFCHFILELGGVGMLPNFHLVGYMVSLSGFVQSSVLLCFFYFQSWLAFSKLHKPFFTEHGSVGFPNTKPPKDENNNAYCKVSFQEATITTFEQHN